MSDAPSRNLGGLDIELARRIDEACRRFEADWRERRRPRIEEYLVDVSLEGRPALRAELEALERELGQADQTSSPCGRPSVGCRAPNGTMSFHDSRSAHQCPWFLAHFPDPGHGARGGIRASHTAATGRGHC